MGSSTRSHFFAALAGGLVVAVVMSMLPAGAANFDPMYVGQKNNAIRATKLISRGGLHLYVGRVGWPALTLQVKGDTAPIVVNSDTLVENLNADLLDGLNASAFSLDGHDHDIDYLAVGGTAADSDLLDGHDSAYFAIDGHDHDTDYLAVGGTAADSDLLDGYDSSFFAPQGLTCPPGETLVGRSSGGAICSSPIGAVTVDDSAAVGQYTSLVLDADGNPVISYYDVTNQDLKLAVCGDPACSTVTVRTVDDTEGQVGQWTSLVLDASGNPRISYYSNPPETQDEALKLAVCDDPTCASATLRVVDSPLNQSVGDHSSMALDPDGYPVIAYHSSQNGKLKLAHCDDATCSSATINDVHGDTEPMSLGLRVSLALDRDGNPIMAYIETAPTNSDLWVAHCSDPDCATAPTVTEVVTGEEALPATRSMALDAAGNPIIAYWDRVADHLKVLHCGDPTCATSTTQTVDDTGAVGNHLSMVLSPMGHPVIAYQDFTSSGDGDLKLALCHDPGCSDATLVVLQSDGDTGEWTSVALDAAGNPVVAYFHDETDVLRLAALMR